MFSTNPSPSKGLKLSSAAEIVFRDLYEECRLSRPGANLCHGLRFRLERFNEKERKTIVNKKKDGCTPLFIAAKRGNVEIVEYLVNTCHADVEEKGLYQVPDDQSIHKVSPLWCAAVAGRLQVVKCLVKYGANVNCVSDTGSTPVRSACFMTYYDIVKFLVESGADITIPNYNGGTCLINSVQSVPLCQYLLEKGAAVDAVDIQNKTALHYAIQEHRLDTAKLLIRFAADPFIKSRYGDDALQTACLKGATEIFEYLLNEIWYPVERIADAHELIGSTFLDEHHDLQIALRFWRPAIQIRNIPEPPVQKAVLPPNPAYGNMKEYETLEELDSMAGNLEAMRLQSLMICERILGLKHKDLIFRLDKISVHEREGAEVFGHNPNALKLLSTTWKK
uniref:Fem-1B n=1 Tax=Artemia franciscana TaxID=6661 RepID=A0A2S0XSU9_ARTSF|nr:Fem-1B [Artemia franciscana]